MENQIQLNIPQFHSVARSFTQKINLKNYVSGHDYEMVDFFASHNEAIPVEEATPEKIAEVSERLYKTARKEIESSIEAYLLELREDSDMPAELSVSELTPIADLIAEMSAATTKTKLQAVKDKATERKTEMTASQQQHLASLFRKTEAKL